MRQNIKRKFIATLCTVTMIVGNMSISTYADDAALKITKQPTNANPTVTVNKDDATYQWYKAEAEEEYKVVENAGTIVDDEIVAATVKDNYVGNGVWANETGSTGLNIGILSGDIVRVTPQDGYEISANLPGIAQTLTDDGTGVLVYEATRDVVTELYIYPATEGGVSAKVEIVRDGVTYPVVDGMEKVIGGAIGTYVYIGSYDENDEEWNSNSSGGLNFILYLKENQIINFNMDNIELGEIMIIAPGYDENEIIPSSGAYTYYVPEEGLYQFKINNGISFGGDIKVYDVARGQVVAGQTTNTLTSIEEGEIYSCFVTSGEEEVWSDYIVAEMAIEKQPTSMEPTVKVNYPDEVESYQWYSAGDVVLDLIYGDDAAADGEIQTSDVWDGEYYDGIWHSEDGRIDASVYANKGDKVIITLPDDFAGEVYDYDTEEYFDYNNGVYEGVIVEDDGYINFTIAGSEDYTAEIQVKTYGIEDAIEGETTGTLGNYEVGETYVCKIVSKEDTELLSEYVSMLVEIITQPTAGNPTVEVNFPDAVSGYQWYGVSNELLTVVDGEVAEGEIEVDYIWDGTYADGIWESEDRYIDMAVKANKGDKVMITLPDDFDGNVYEYNSESFSYNNGVYEYVIDSANGYLNFVIESDVEFTAEILVKSFTLGDAIATETAATLNNAEIGKTYACEVTCEYGAKLMSDYVTMDIDIASQPIATNPTVEVNFPDEVAGYQWYTVELESIEVVDESAANSSDVIGAEVEDGAYENGVWTAEAYDMNGETYYDIILMFEVNEGYTVKIVPSTDAIEETMCQSPSNLEELKCEDGVYYFEAEISGLYAIGLLASEEFTAEITVEKLAKGEAVEGQTTNKLTNHEAGDYICEITLSDDTVLLSNIVSIAEADITHTYTDEYDADCNDCGAIREVPEGDEDTDTDTDNDADSDDKDDATISGDGSGSLDDENSPETGDGVNMMLLFAIALVGVIGTFATSVKKRRYQ